MNDLEKNSILITLRNESYEILSPLPTVSLVSVSVFCLCSLYIPAKKMYKYVGDVPSYCRRFETHVSGESVLCITV